MIRLGTHLHDDRLHECYLAERCGEALDPREVDHLAECASCQARFAAFGRLMDDVREAGDREVDALFPAERLAEQRGQILRRLDHVMRPAKVLSFPGRVTKHIATASTRIAPRWLVASAAAGLLVGVGLGGFLAAPERTRQDTVRSASAPAYGAAANVHMAPASPRPAAATPVSETLDDDRFLRELEVALERPHTRELLPIDTWTPHVREIGSRVR